MAMFKSIATFALKNVVEGTVIAMGGEFAAAVCEQVGGKVAGYFRDPSRVVLTALQKAAEQALDTVEGALAGSGLFGGLAPGEVKGLCARLETLLEHASLEGKPLDRAWRKQCLKEWKAARKSGLFALATDSQALEAALDPFARFRNQADLIAAEDAALRELESAVRAAGHPMVAQFLSIRQSGGSNLFALAVQHHFQSAIPKDHVLRDTVFHAQLNGLSAGQRAILDQLIEARSDWKVEWKRLETSLVERFKAELSQRQPRIGDGLTIRGPAELKLMTEFRERLRSLPAEVLDNSDLETLARAFHCTGRYDTAGPLLEIAAGLASEDRERARSLYTAFINTLERRELEKAKRFAEATRLLREALALDPSLVPFDVKQYPVLSVLGAGGFGVVVLCGYGRYGMRRSVFKILRTDGLDRDPEAFMLEAELLATIEHPNVIRVLDAKVGKVSDGTSVPYLELDYFDGEDLDSYVAAHGPFAPRDALAIGIQIAHGLAAAHAKGIWHRDVKPANAMLRKTATGYEVKLIDFGLAAKHEEMDRSLAAQRGGDGTSIVADSVLGTVEYAAPEQLGKLKGVSVGPYSDVYGLGRTLCYLLLQRTELKAKDLRALPSEIVELIEECLEHEPKARFGGAKADKVRERLEALVQPKSSAELGAKPSVEPSRPNQEIKSKAPATPEVISPREAAELITKLAKSSTASAAPAAAGYDALGQRSFDGLRPLGKNRNSGLYEFWHPASGSEPKRRDDGHFRIADDSAIVMVLLPGGTFSMGAQKRDKNQPNYDPGAADDESPVQRVTLDPYFLAKYPLTQGQWQKLTGANPAGNNKKPNGRERPLAYPIENVSWEECSQALAKIGLVLPTEAQWEYGCRAGTSTPWWCGDENALKKIAAINGTSGGHTALVDSLGANPFGLFHVHGNVWEWCQDWKQPYGSAQPRAGDGLRPGSGSSRVYRGGSYYLSAADARSARRGNGVPGNRFGSLGCRPARVPT